MITKEEFENLVNDYIKQDGEIKEVEDILGIDFTTASWIEYGFTLFDKVMNILFDDDANETIYWWIFEKRFNPELEMKDENGNIIPTKTLDDIWEIVKDGRK